MENLKCKNVEIGMKFKKGQNLICEVIDFYILKSALTGEIVDYQCIAKETNGYFKGNLFKVPFATVVRNIIK